MRKKKKYITTIETEWEMNGDVAPEKINERIAVAVNCYMMTLGSGRDFATSHSGCAPAVLTTVEAPNLKELCQ